MSTVLLVEDSKFDKLKYERILIKAGYRVITATDGEEGIRQAQQFLPDIVLLDLLLPKVSGEEVLRSLKRTQLTAHIPVIILTALSQQNAPKLIKEGATAYFQKSPLDSSPKLLLDTINQLFPTSSTKI